MVFLFILFNYIYIALVLFDGLTGTFNSETGIGLLSAIFTLGIIIPSLAVSIRRLHDTDRSGWWLLIAFIPLIGPIVMIVFCAQDSQPNENRFGENPKLKA